MSMVIAVVSLAPVQFGTPYIPRWGFMVILIWLKVPLYIGIMQTWRFPIKCYGLLVFSVPYINIFVSYHLCLKNLAY